ncbi:hypothetical protein EDM00_09335 [Ornithobacterium rhinotracheale]|uniref:hypothetical protein n=1 Tax=Ornithobacterium rhinotracheale TaxID=28251 RepID=UPI00129CA3BA|nr:hypothetical protein [Ornithobacterium rhinotracheale]MRI64189.1 hypothetical protein [Ornithobacterium rhinotracheale]
MKHWSYYLEDKGGRIQDLSLRLCQKLEKLENLRRLYLQESTERDVLEQELEKLMGEHWSQEEIKKAMAKASAEWNTVRKTVEIPPAIEEAMRDFLATLEPKDNIVEFMKWSLYEHLSEKTGLQVSRMKLHHYLKEYCRKKGYVYMPDEKRIQKEHSGKIMDFIQIRIK